MLRLHWFSKITCRKLGTGYVGMYLLQPKWWMPLCIMTSCFLLLLVAISNNIRSNWVGAMVETVNTRPENTFEHIFWSTEFYGGVDTANTLRGLHDQLAFSWPSSFFGSPSTVNSTHGDIYISKIPWVVWQVGTWLWHWRDYNFHRYCLLFFYENYLIGPRLIAASWLVDILGYLLWYETLKSLIVVGSISANHARLSRTHAPCRPSVCAGSVASSVSGSYARVGGPTSELTPRPHFFVDCRTQRIRLDMQCG